MDSARYRLEDFELYQLACALRRKVYALIRRLPAQERFELAPQMRRAALSVSNNIAEGHGRWHYQETTHFCRIARGSVSEVIDDLNVCLDEGYGGCDTNRALKQDAYALIARINGYIAYLRRVRLGQNE